MQLTTNDGFWPQRESSARRVPGKLGASVLRGVEGKLLVGRVCRAEDRGLSGWLHRASPMTLICSVEWFA
jgi:hypothetical protein